MLNKGTDEARAKGERSNDQDLKGIVRCSSFFEIGDRNCQGHQESTRDGDAEPIPCIGRHGSRTLDRADGSITRGFDEAGARGVLLATELLAKDVGRLTAANRFCAEFPLSSVDEVQGAAVYILD